MYTCSFFSQGLGDRVFWRETSKPVCFLGGRAGGRTCIFERREASRRLMLFTSLASTRPLITSTPVLRAPPAAGDFTGIMIKSLVGDFEFRALCMPTVPWGKSTRKMPFFGCNDETPLLVSVIMGLQHAFAMIGGGWKAPPLYLGVGQRCAPIRFCDRRACAVYKRQRGTQPLRSLVFLF